MDALTPSTAAQAGLSRSALYRGARAGRLDRIARGIYLPAKASAADWDLLEAATRRPDATICLISALAHYDLTDAIPAALDVAIPRGSRTPASTGAIADAFRLRGRVGYELARDALREWLRRGGKPARLIEIASRLPRAKSPILQALDMLG